MRICILASLYKPYARGGAEVVAQTVATALSQEHEVIIVTTMPWSGIGSLLPQVSIEDGITVYRFYPLNFFSFFSINSRPAFLRFAWQVVDMFNVHSYWVIRYLLAHLSPDLILTHNLKGLGYLVTRAIARTRLPHIHTVHDVQLYTASGLILFGEENARAHTNLIVRCYRMLCRKVFSSPPFVVFPSYFLRAFYRNEGFFPSSTSVVMRNPVGFIPPNPSALSSNQKKFLFIGQLEPHKGILILLEAFSALSSADARLIIIGEGSCMPAVMRAADVDSRIQCVGRQDQERVREYLSEVDCMVMPTVCYENAPLVVVEGVLTGIPVIVSDIGGAAEHVTHGVNGLRVPPGDIGALKEALEMICAGHRDKLSGSRPKLPNAQEYSSTLLSLIVKTEDSNRSTATRE